MPSCQRRSWWPPKGKRLDSKKKFPGYMDLFHRGRVAGYKAVAHRRANDGPGPGGKSSSVSLF
jgi:hypothetical protein